MSLLQRHRLHRDLPPFPTRRSSDLGIATRCVATALSCGRIPAPSFPTITAIGPSTRPAPPFPCTRSSARCRGDRKSTRLNSSHVAISYAVFCLKKKKPQRVEGHEEH